MLGPPVDAWYVWIGLAAASVALLGVAVALPTTPAPDAERVARTVGSVAASPYNATGAVPLSVDAVRLGPERVSLRRDGVTAHASFGRGAITPVDNGSLAAVLSGTPPSGQFDSPGAFAAACERARSRSPSWTPAPDELAVRHVTWGDVDVTLAG